MNQTSHVNTTNFLMEGLALGLALKWRRNPTRKSPIDKLGTSVILPPCGPVAPILGLTALLTLTIHHKKFTESYQCVMQLIMVIYYNRDSLIRLPTVCSQRFSQLSWQSVRTSNPLKFKTFPLHLVGLWLITMRQEAKVSRLGWEFCWACMYFSNIFSSYDVISAHAVVYQRLTQEQHAFDGVKMSSLLLSSNKSGVNFEDKWHELKPTVNKLLKQEPVTTQEWQNLFW